MKVGFGADHAGFELKQHLMETARSLGHESVDYGTYSAESVDYPDFAEPVARDTVAGEIELGVVICSNGVGVSIVANKVPGARAALCHTGWGASRARQHAQLAGRELHGQLDHPDVFLKTQGGRLARGAHRNNPVHPRLDLAPDQAIQCRFIHPPVLERGDDRRVGSG